MSRHAAAVAPVSTPAQGVNAPTLQRPSVRLVEAPAPEVEKPEPVALASSDSGGAADAPDCNRPDFVALSIGSTSLSDPDLARAAVTRLLLQELAPALGLDPKRIRVNIGREAEARVNARGASGLQEGATIHLHPARYRPETPEGRYLLAHEAVHAAQRRLGGVADVPAAEAEAAQLAEAFAAREPLRQPIVALPALTVAANTGAELPFDTLAWQNHESEFARIRKLLGGLWISDGDVNKVLLILKTLEPPTALALLKQLESNERVDLVDNMHSVHRKGFRAEVLLCYWSLWQEEIEKNFDEDLFEDMNLSEPPLSVQEAFYVDYVVRHLKQRAQNKLRKSRNGHAIEVIQQFAADGGNRSRWQDEARQELQKARGEEDEQARIRKETEEVWFKDQSGADKENKPAQLRNLVESIRKRLDTWIVSDSTVLGILKELEPYARDMSTLRAIADGLVTRSYEEKDGKYQYHEDKDYFQKLIDEVPVKELYRQNSPLRRTFLQLLLVRPGYKSIETVIKLTDEGFFSHVTSEDAYLAYQLVRSMPPRARKAIMEFEGGERWGKVTSNLSMSQREGDTTNFYQGGKNGEDRNSILAQLLPDEIWAQAGRLQGVIGQAIAAGHYDWVFEESRRHYVVAKGYVNDDIVAVAEMYKLYNPEARNDKGEPAPRLVPDDKLLKGNPFWNEGTLGFINQKIFGGLNFIFGSDDVEVATRALGGTGLNLAEFQEITGGSFLGARFERQDRLGMEGAEAKRKKKGVNYANMKWDRKLGVLEFEAERLAIAAINYPMTDMTIRTGRVDLNNVTVKLSYPTDSTPGQINVIDLYIGEAEIDNLMLIAPDSMKSINQVHLDGFRVLAKPSGKDLSQMDRPRDGALNQGLAVDLYWTISNVAGAAGSGAELGNNVLKPSGGMELEVSLRSLRLKGVTTSSGSYVESVVVENLDIGGGGTVDAYLRALNISSMRLESRLKRERKALGQSRDDKESSSHQKAIDQLSWQIEHNQLEFTRVQGDQAEIARIEERQKQLAEKNPPEQPPEEERKRLRELKASLMGTVMDVGHVKISGIADSPVKDLDLGNLHGQGRSTTALLGMLSESDTLSRFIEGGQPIVKGAKTGAAFSLDIGHVDLPDLKVRGSVPKPEDAKADLDKFLAKMDTSRPDHVTRMKELQDRVMYARIYDEGMKSGPDRLKGEWRVEFLTARRELLKFEEDNAFRVRSLTLEGAALNFDAEGGIGVGADELNAVGLVDPKTGLKIDSVYARKLALSAKVKDGVLGLKDWRKNVQSGTFKAGELRIRGLDDPDSGIGAEEISAESGDKEDALSASLDLNGGDASAHIAAPKLTVKGANFAFSERLLRLAKTRLEQRDESKLKAQQKRKRAGLLKELNHFLDTLDAIKAAVAQDQLDYAEATAAKDQARTQAASKALAMDRGNLKEWMKRLSVSELSLRELDLSLRGLGAVLDENWSPDRAAEKGITVEAGTAGGPLVGGISVKGMTLRQNGHETVNAQEISTGPIKGRIVYSKAYIRVDDLGIEHLTVSGASYLSPNTTIWAEGSSTLSNITVSAVIHSQPKPDDTHETYLSKVQVDEFHIERIDCDRLGYEDRARGLRVDVSSGSLRDIYLRGLTFELSPDELDEMKIKEDQGRPARGAHNGIGVGSFDDVKLGARLAGGLSMGGRINASTLAVHFAASGGQEIDLAALGVADGKVKKGDLDLDVGADVKGIHVSLLPGGAIKGRARDVTVGVSGSKGKHQFGGRIENADTGDVTYDGKWVTMPALDLPSIKLTHLSVKGADLELEVPAGEETELVGTHASVSLELNDDDKHGATPVRRIYIHEFETFGVAVHGFTVKVPSLGLSITLPNGLSGFINGLYLKPGKTYPEGFIIEPEPGDFPLGKGGVYGAFGFKSASLLKLNANLKDVLDATANLDAEGFEMGFLDDGNFTVDLKKLSGDNISGTIEHAKAKGSNFSILGPTGKPGLEVRGIHYDKDKVTVEGAAIRGVHFADPGHGVTVDIDEASLPSDANGKAFEWPKYGPALVPHLDISKAHFDIDFTKSKAGAASPSAPKTGPWKFDFLDQLNGSLSTDVVIPGLTVKLVASKWRFSGGTDLAVPTDTFPIEMTIENGVINFAKLEKKLFSNSALVQNILDFEVKGNKLVLEADFTTLTVPAGAAAGGSVLPIVGAVPGAIAGAQAKVDIIEWDLEPYERVMAEDDRVRLATLAVGIMKLANKPKTVDPNFSVDVDARWSELELRKVAANLSMKDKGEIDLAGVTGDRSMSGTITLGGSGSDAITGLKAKGDSKNGIDLGLEHAQLGVRDLVLGSTTLNVGAIVVDNVHDCVFKMVSGKPGSLSGTIDSAVATNVGLTK